MAQFNSSNGSEQGHPNEFPGHQPSKSNFTIVGMDVLDCPDLDFLDSSTLLKFEARIKRVAFDKNLGGMSPVPVPLEIFRDDWRLSDIGTVKARLGRLEQAGHIRAVPSKRITSRGGLLDGPYLFSLRYAGDQKTNAFIGALAHSERAIERKRRGRTAAPMGQPTPASAIEHPWADPLKNMSRPTPVESREMPDPNGFIGDRLETDRQTERPGASAGRTGAAADAAPLSHSTQTDRQTERPGASAGRTRATADAAPARSVCLSVCEDMTEAEVADLLDWAASLPTPADATSVRDLQPEMPSKSSVPPRVPIPVSILSPDVEDRLRSFLLELGLGSGQVAEILKFSLWSPLQSWWIVQSIRMNGTYLHAPIPSVIHKSLLADQSRGQEWLAKIPAVVRAADWIGLPEDGTSAGDAARNAHLAAMRSVGVSRLPLSPDGQAEHDRLVARDVLTAGDRHQARESAVRASRAAQMTLETLRSGCRDAAWAAPYREALTAWYAIAKEFCDASIANRKAGKDSSEIKHLQDAAIAAEQRVEDLLAQTGPIGLPNGGSVRSGSPVEWKLLLSLLEAEAAQRTWETLRPGGRHESETSALRALLADWDVKAKASCDARMVTLKTGRAPSEADRALRVEAIAAESQVSAVLIKTGPIRLKNENWVQPANTANWIHLLRFLRDSAE